MCVDLLPCWPQHFKDTLVVTWTFDDITMDPAESFEISAGEVMGNSYDRLLRYDVSDPSKLLPDIAKSWTVSPDDKTYTFEIKPGLKFASGNPLTAEDVAYSLQRAVILDKTPAFILTQFGFTKENVKDKIRAIDGRSLVLLIDKPYAPTSVAEQPDRQRCDGHRPAVGAGQRKNGDQGLRLAQDHFRRFRSWHEAQRMASQRHHRAGAQ